MSDGGRVLKNTIVHIGAKVLGTFLGLVAIGIMTRTLGTTGFGTYTAVNTFLNVFAVLADFGISTTTVAMLAEHGADEHRIARGATTLRIALTSAAMLLAISSALLFAPYHAPWQTVVLLGMSFVAVSWQQIQVALFQRHVRLVPAAILELFGRTLLVLGMIVVAMQHGGLIGTAIAIVIANGLQALCAMPFVSTFMKDTFTFDGEMWRVILVRTWPIGVSIFLNLLYLRADMVILSWTHSAEEVGLYGAAYRVVDVLTVVPMLFMGVVLPFLSSAASQNDIARFRRVLTRALDALSLLAAPLAVGSFLVGKDLLATVAGEPFRGAGIYLMPLGSALACIFLAAVFTHAVVALKKQKEMIPLLASVAAVCVGMYLYAIPRGGAHAASLITLLSEFLAMIAAASVCLAHNMGPTSWKNPLKALAAALLMIPIAHILPHLWVGVTILLLGSAYLVFALLFGAISREDMRLLIRT